MTAVIFVTTIEIYVKILLVMQLVPGAVPSMEKGRRVGSFSDIFGCCQNSNVSSKHLKISNHENTKDEPFSDQRRLEQVGDEENYGRQLLQHQWRDLRLSLCRRTLVLYEHGADGLRLSCWWKCGKLQ